MIINFVVKDPEIGSSNHKMRRCTTNTGNKSLDSGMAKIQELRIRKPNEFHISVWFYEGFRNYYDVTVTEEIMVYIKLHICILF
jgi:hypothetical protein